MLSKTNLLASHCFQQGSEMDRFEVRGGDTTFFPNAHVLKEPVLHFSKEPWSLGQPRSRMVEGNSGQRIWSEMFSHCFGCPLLEVLIDNVHESWRFPNSVHTRGPWLFALRCTLTAYPGGNTQFPRCSAKLSTDYTPMALLCPGHFAGLDGLQTHVPCLVQHSKWVGA